MFNELKCPRGVTAAITELQYKKAPAGEAGAFKQIEF
jgi:hypothetical protein